MKILFIWPNKGSFGFNPIGLGLLSAILKREGHEVGLFDTTFIDFGYKDNTEILSKIKNFKQVNLSGYELDKKKVNLRAELIKRLDSFRPDIVGISALSDEVEIGLSASRIVKQWNSNIPVLWGNKAATMIPEKILSDRNVDYLCIGEGIEFIKEFTNCLAHGSDPRNLKNIAYRDQRGKMQRNSLRPYFEDLDSLPFLDGLIFDPRQSIKVYDGNIYIGADHMISWGCPRSCTYCINHAYRRLYNFKAGRLLRWYSVDRIVNELKYIRNKRDVTLFKFHDEDFTLKPIPYFRELAERYQSEVNIPFVAMANAATINEEKVRLLKRMNCVSISIGIENGNEYIRRNILKRQENKKDIICAVRMLNNAGIRTSSFNMLGVPFETRSTVMETIELNRKSHIQYPNTVFFYPLEGTELHDIAVKNKLFNHRAEAIFDDIHPTLNLPNISKEELVALRERFVLYVKMPKSYYKYIERSEKADDIGKRLTIELYKIYDKCVFSNEGRWDDGGRNREYLNHLEVIYKKARTLKSGFNKRKECLNAASAPRRDTTT